MTYSVGDIIYFRRYYEDQDAETKEIIKRLISNGQLDVQHGGLVSPDSACPNYSDVLRNFEIGHDYLREGFGITPNIAMQLDPFGTTRGLVEIFAEIGFDAMFITRVNSGDYHELLHERSLQFNWKPRVIDLDKKTNQNHASMEKEIFTHVTFDHYNPPNFVSRNDYSHGAETKIVYNKKYNR